MFYIVVDEVFVDFVGEDEDVVLEGEFYDGLEFWF